MPESDSQVTACLAALSLREFRHATEADSQVVTVYLPYLHKRSIGLHVLGPTHPSLVNRLFNLSSNNF